MGDRQGLRRVQGITSCLGLKCVSSSFCTAARPLLRHQGLPTRSAKARAKTLCVSARSHLRRCPRAPTAALRSTPTPTPAPCFVLSLTCIAALFRCAQVSECAESGSPLADLPPSCVGQQHPLVQYAPPLSRRAQVSESAESGSPLADLSPEELQERLEELERDNDMMDEFDEVPDVPSVDMM